MTPLHSVRPENTVVRVRVAAARVANAIGNVVAPSWSARVALRQWYRIPDTPALRNSARDAAIPGGVDFETTSQGSTIRGKAWGEGPVVYLVHGWAGSADQMAKLVEPLLLHHYRVITFDGPSHGRSQPGPSGPRRSNGVEFARALGAISAVFGPARAVVAHSLGAMATMLALRFGTLSTERLVFLAPMSGVEFHLSRLSDALNLGARTRQRMWAQIHDQLGMTVEDFDLLKLQPYAANLPLLVVHDTSDRYWPYENSARLVQQWPRARMLTTEGLGHNRLLGDGQVAAAVADFVAGGSSPVSGPR